MLSRPSKGEIENAILDVAAGLLAQRGVAQTSLQAIADGVGYSKAGLLHHFASKDAIVAATVARCREGARALGSTGDGLDAGVARDRAVLTTLIDLAVTAPGFVALILAGTAGYGDASVSALLGPIDDDLFAAFGARGDGEDVGRTLAITGALGALAVAALTITSPEAQAWDVAPAAMRDHVLRVAMGALGHPGAAPSAATGTGATDDA